MGVGDPMGMHVAHAVAGGMGGIRTAGDLVARCQVTRAMKLRDAKKYVAEKLHVSIEDLHDPVVMSEVREDLGLGRVNMMQNQPKGIDAKFRIADVLGIEINCVNVFKRRVGWPV